MEEKNGSTPYFVDPSNFLPELSAEQVHLNLLRCHKLGNRVNEKEIYWLYVMIAGDHIRKITGPGVIQYVMESLDCERTAASERIEVAKLVPKLPRSLEAFKHGEISWWKLKRIASIVELKKDEGPWLEFAKNHKPGELKAEVLHALETGRSTPRKGRYGLPNIRHSMRFDFSREEYEIVRKALQKMAAHLWESDRAEGKGAEGEHEGHERDGECGHGACGQGRTPAQVLLALALKVLEADLPGFLSKGRNRSIYSLVYETCLSCKQGHMLTDCDGPLEVTPERIRRVEETAEKIVVLDDELVPGEALSPGEVAEEIPQEVLAKVLALSNNACAHCGRRIDLHVHHILFKSDGGPNDTWNLCVACPGCHSAVHRGVLEVWRDSLGRLHWRSLAQRLTALLADEVKELSEIPQVVVTVPAKEAAKEVLETVLPEAPPDVPQDSPPDVPPDVPADVPAAATPSTPPAEPTPAEASGRNGTGQAAGATPEGATAGTIAPEVKREAMDVTRVLRKLGMSAEEARERTARALVLLSHLQRKPSGNEILNTAFRGQAVVLGPRPVAADAANGTGPDGRTSDEARRKGSTGSGAREGGPSQG
jgi:hypothetical protein